MCSAASAGAVSILPVPPRKVSGAMVTRPHLELRFSLRSSRQGQCPPAYLGYVEFHARAVKIVKAELHPWNRFIIASSSCPVVNMSAGRFFKGSSAMLLIAAAIGTATARDDGRYSGSPLKPWFDTLKSGRGLCCSDADGFAVLDPDWESIDGHYRVRLEGVWIVVPEDAVITEPNRAGRTMVWPIKGSLGTSIRCFLPGSMS